MERTYPNPDNTDPSTRDRVNVGEAPVGVGGDDGGDELGETERTHEGERGTLHEEEAVRTGDEDQSLGDHGDLEVDDHVEFTIVVVASSRRSTTLESDTELVVEPSGADDDSDESNPVKRVSAEEQKL